MGLLKSVAAAVTSVFSPADRELQEQRKKWRKQLAMLPELVERRHAAHQNVVDVRAAVARAEEFPAKIAIAERELSEIQFAEQAAKRCEQHLKDSAPQELRRKHQIACKAEPAAHAKARDLRNKLPDLEKDLKAADELLQTLERVPQTRTLDALQQMQWETDIRRARFNCGELRNSLGETREQIAGAEAELQTAIRERAKALQALIDA